MTVKLARLQSIPEEEPVTVAAPKRRKEARFAAWFDARLENAHGDGVDVLLADVSLHGCRVRCEERWLRTGSFVSISIESGNRLQGVIRWIRDGFVGMEFLRPIPSDRTEWLDLMDTPC